MCAQNHLRCLLSWQPLHPIPRDSGCDQGSLWFHKLRRWLWNRWSPFLSPRAHKIGWHSNSCPWENLHLELRHPPKGTSETTHWPLLPFSQSLHKPIWLVLPTVSGHLFTVIRTGLCWQEAGPSQLFTVNRGGEHALPDSGLILPQPPHSSLFTSCPLFQNQVVGNLCFLRRAPYPLKIFFF